jgi:hypothetical protein
MFHKHSGLKMEKCVKCKVKTYAIVLFFQEFIKRQVH